MKIFNLESPFMQFLSRVADLMLLNLLWIICSFPVFTVGAATTALYDRILRILDEKDESSIFLDFFRAFKRNFKPATLTWLILLLPFALVLFYFVLVLANQVSFSYTILIPLVFLIFVISYVFPLIARYENSIFNYLKNAAMLSIANLFSSIAMAAITLMPLVIFFASVDYFLRLSIFWLLIGISFTAYVNCLLLRNVFKKLEPSTEAIVPNE